MIVNLFREPEEDPTERMVMAINKSLNKSRSWAAWSGDTESLRRIGRIVSDLYRDHPINQEAEDKSALEKSESRLNPTVSFAHIASISNTSITNYVTVSADDEIESYPFLGAILIDDEQTSGDFEEVLAELDRRSIRKIIFAGAIAPRDKVIISFEKGESPPVVLSIQSPHPSWGRQALARLSDEIEKGVPSWSFIHERRMASFIFRLLAVIILAAAATMAIMKNFFTEEGGGLFLFTCLPFSFIISSDRVAGWFFPSIEILGEGAQSTGSRRIVSVILLLFSIPIGILVNRIS
ncbi:hypothetical protein ACWDUI_26700 [Streptosporangium sandarakinum]